MAQTAALPPPPATPPPSPGRPVAGCLPDAGLLCVGLSRVWLGARGVRTHTLGWVVLCAGGWHRPSSPPPPYPTLCSFTVGEGEMDYYSTFDKRTGGKYVFESRESSPATVVGEEGSGSDAVEPLGYSA